MSSSLLVFLRRIPFFGSFETSPIGEFIFTNPWYYTAGAICVAYTFVALIAIIMRIVNKHGQIIKFKLGRMSNPKYARDLFVVSGDILAEVIHEEMFGREGHAYLKHGVVLPTKFIREKAPALVVDVGANIGLFGMSMEIFGEQDLVDSRGCRVPGTTASSKKQSSGSSASPNSKAERRSVSAQRRSASATRKSEVVRKTVSNINNNNNNDVASYTGPLLPAVRVIGFEPIPETYECCRRNYESVFAETNKAFPEHASAVYQFGIGDKNMTANFHYDPCSSAAASMNMDDMTKAFDGKLIQTIGAWLIDFGRYPLYRMHTFGDFLYAPFYITILAMGKSLSVPFFPARLVFLFAVLPVLIAMFIFRIFALPGSKKLDCQILTLPEALKRAGADDPDQSIAFLKIDVEGAEESVCNGIDDVTWARVHQAVVEVHDTPDGRLNRLVNMLKAQGFKRITVDEEPLELHKLGNIKTIFATRG